MRQRTIVGLAMEVGVGLVVLALAGGISVGIVVGTLRLMRLL